MRISSFLVPICYLGLVVQEIRLIALFYILRTHFQSLPTVHVSSENRQNANLATRLGPRYIQGGLRQTCIEARGKMDGWLTTQGRLLALKLPLVSDKLLLYYTIRRLVASPASPLLLLSVWHWYLGILVLFLIIII